MLLLNLFKTKASYICRKPCLSKPVSKQIKSSETVALSRYGTKFVLDRWTSYSAEHWRILRNILHFVPELARTSNGDTFSKNGQRNRTGWRHRGKCGGSKVDIWQKQINVEEISEISNEEDKLFVMLTHPQATVPATLHQVTATVTTVIILSTALWVDWRIRPLSGNKPSQGCGRIILDFSRQQSLNREVQLGPNACFNMLTAYSFPPCPSLNPPF